MLRVRPPLTWGKAPPTTSSPAIADHLHVVLGVSTCLQAAKPRVCAEMARIHDHSHQLPTKLNFRGGGHGRPFPPRPKLAVQSEPQPSVFRTGPDKGANFASRGGGAPARWHVWSLSRGEVKFRGEWILVRRLLPDVIVAS